MNRTTRYAIYGVIIVICIIAIIVSVFEAVSREENTIPQTKTNTTPTNVVENTTGSEITQAQLEEDKTNFKNLFKNDYYDFENSDIAISKENQPEAEVVYSLAERIVVNNSIDSEARYDFDVEFPFINHNSYNGIEIDNDTDYSTFYGLITALTGEYNNIRNNNEAKGLKIYYTGSLYKNILSIGVWVERTMLDGTNDAQYNFYAYNYDLSSLATSSDESEIRGCTLNNMFDIAGTSGTTINEEITKIVEAADKYSSELSSTEQSVYSRKLTSSMYDVSKTGSFSQRQYFIHEDSDGTPCLYIVYVYGNDTTKWTTALDVVKIPIEE